jgi:hypothetical protein
MGLRNTPLRLGDVCQNGDVIATSTQVYRFRRGEREATVCLACHRRSSRAWQRARRLGMTSMAEYRAYLEREEAAREAAREAAEREAEREAAKALGMTVRRYRRHLADERQRELKRAEFMQDWRARVSASSVLGVSWRRSEQ